MMDKKEIMRDWPEFDFNEYYSANMRARQESHIEREKKAIAQKAKLAEKSFIEWEGLWPKKNKPAAPLRTRRGGGFAGY